MTRITKPESTHRHDKKVLTTLDAALKLQVVVFSAVNFGKLPLDETGLPARTHIRMFSNELLRMAFFADARNQARREPITERETAWVDEAKLAMRSLATCSKIPNGLDSSLLFSSEKPDIHREIFHDFRELVVPVSPSIDGIDSGMPYATAVADGSIVMWEKDQLGLV